MAESLFLKLALPLGNTISPGMNFSVFGFGVCSVWIYIYW